MALTNYDAIISARSSGQYEDPFCIKSESITPLAAGHWISLINAAGVPSSHTLTSAAGGVALCSTHAGAIPLTTNSTTLSRYLLSAGVGSMGVGSFGCAMLVDVLWGIAGIPYTGATYDINSTAVPLTRSTDGVGNQIMFVEQSSHTTATNSTVTITYTNSAGTTGRAATTFALSTLSRAHHIRPIGMPFVQLAAGDVGVKSIEKISFNATHAGGGTLSVFMVKPLLTVPIIGSGGYVEKDQVLQLEGMIRLSEGTDGKLPYLGWIASGIGAVANTVFYSQIRTVYG